MLFVLSGLYYLNILPVLEQGRYWCCRYHRNISQSPFGRKSFSSFTNITPSFCIKDEGLQTQCKDHQGIGPHELVVGHISGNGQAQHDGDEICQHILGGLAQHIQHRVFSHQVTEHQKVHSVPHCLEPPMPAMILTTMGNRILVSWETLPFPYYIRMRRSFCVVSSWIPSVCTMGTSSM